MPSSESLHVPDQEEEDEEEAAPKTNKQTNKQGSAHLSDDIKSWFFNSEHRWSFARSWMNVCFLAPELFAWCSQEIHCR